MKKMMLPYPVTAECWHPGVEIEDVEYPVKPDLIFKFFHGGDDWKDWKEACSDQYAMLKTKTSDALVKNGDWIVTFIDGTKSVWDTNLINSLMAKTDYTEGARQIFMERARQVESECWNADHDDSEHPNGELLQAAVCMLFPDGLQTDKGDSVPKWPWHPDYDKRDAHSHLRRLQIAGALIAAEIDRLERQKD